MIEEVELNSELKYESRAALTAKAVSSPNSRVTWELMQGSTQRQGEADERDAFLIRKIAGARISV